MLENVELEGVKVNIYRTEGKSYDGSISSKTDFVTVITGNIGGTMANNPPTEEAPAVRIVARQGSNGVYYLARPVEPPPAGSTYASGGTYLNVYGINHPCASWGASMIPLHDFIYTQEHADSNWH